MPTNPKPSLAPTVEKYVVENGPMTLELRSAGQGLTHIGGGILRFDSGGAGEPWKLPYDEMIYVLTGALRLKTGDAELLCHPGDVVTIPRGAEVVYDGDPGTTAFYALSPADWWRDHPNGL